MATAAVFGVYMQSAAKKAHDPLSIAKMVERFARDGKKGLSIASAIDNVAETLNKREGNASSQVLKLRQIVRTIFLNERRRNFPAGSAYQFTVVLNPDEKKGLNAGADIKQLAERVRDEFIGGKSFPDALDAVCLRHAHDLRCKVAECIINPYSSNPSFARIFVVNLSA